MRLLLRILMGKNDVVSTPRFYCYGARSDWGIGGFKEVIFIIGNDVVGIVNLGVSCINNRSRRSAEAHIAYIGYGIGIEIINERSVLGRSVTVV